MRKILSEHRCLGLLMQRASYSCRADVELACEDLSVTLKYVPEYQPVSARMRVAGGGEDNVGRLTLTPAGMPVTARPIRDETDLPAFIFHLDPHWLDREWRSAFALDVAAIPHVTNVRDDSIERTLARLSSELRQPGLASDAMVKSLVRILAIDLARYVQAQTVDSAAKDELSRSRLEQIQHFVLNFSAGAPSLGAIAADCALSPSHLSRLFKQGTGLTVQEYVEKVRIEKARALLSECDLPLKVISHRLGYSHPSAFSVAFKRATGETPQSYRQRSDARFAAARRSTAYAPAAPLMH